MFIWSGYNIETEQSDIEIVRQSDRETAIQRDINNILSHRNGRAQRQRIRRKYLQTETELHRQTDIEKRNRYKNTDRDIENWEFQIETW